MKSRLVTYWRVSYKKQELLTLREHLSSPPGFGSCCSSFSYVCLRSEFRVVMSLEFRHIKTMFGLSLPPAVVCRKANVLFTLLVCVCV